jgi:hypothetical protein
MGVDDHSPAPALAVWARGSYLIPDDAFRSVPAGAVQVGHEKRDQGARHRPEGRTGPWRVRVWKRGPASSPRPLRATQWRYAAALARGTALPAGTTITGTCESRKTAAITPSGLASPLGAPTASTAASSRRASSPSCFAGSPSSMTRSTGTARSRGSSARHATPRGPAAAGSEVRACDTACTSRRRAPRASARREAARAMAPDGPRAAMAQRMGPAPMARAPCGTAISGHAASRERSTSRGVRAAQDGRGYDEPGLIARRRCEQPAQALVLRGGLWQGHEQQSPPEAAREASREPDRLVSRVNVESAHDGLFDADELAPLRDHFGAARGVGQLGHRNPCGHRP